MPNHANDTYITMLLNTPLELKDWSNHVDFNQDRLTELVSRILNSPDFKDYLVEDQGKKRVLELIKIYDSNILTFTDIDYLLSSGIYNIYTSILEKSLLIEVDNSVWLYVDVKRMSMSNIEIELYF